MAEKRKGNRFQSYCLQCKVDNFLRSCEFEGCGEFFHSESMGRSLTCGHGEEPNNHLPNTKKERSTSQQALKNKEGKCWGSKPLIDFLESVGTDTSIEVSQLDAEVIVRRHVTAKNLFTDEKKRKFRCDEKLTTLFGQKQVITKNIYKLLELHYRENAEFHEQDQRSFSSEEENKDEDTCLAQGKQRKMGKFEKNEEKVVTKCTRSCFASVVAENIKLVYLRKSVVIELTEELETFESMVLGSFVKVKSDPNNHRQKNRYQLVQITGVKNMSPRGEKEDILLQASDRCTDFSISMLCEGDFSEEECEDLNQRVKSGQLPKLTIVDIEENAKRLHIVITKDLIVKKLARLQNKMDIANEKGRRALFFQCSEEKELLETEAEQTRLLEEVPKVIAEELEIESVPDSANKSLTLGDEVPLKSEEKYPSPPPVSSMMNHDKQELSQSYFQPHTEAVSTVQPSSKHLHRSSLPALRDMKGIEAEQTRLLEEVPKVIAEEPEIESIPDSANQSLRLGDKILLKSGDKSDFDNFVSGNTGSSLANNGIKKKEGDEVQMGIKGPNVHRTKRLQLKAKVPQHMAEYDTSIALKLFIDESIPDNASTQSARLGDKIPLKSGDKSDVEDNFGSGNTGSSSANYEIKKKKRDEKSGNTGSSSANYEIKKKKRDEKSGNTRSSSANYGIKKKKKDENARNTRSSSANYGIKKKKRDEIQTDIEGPNVHGVRRSQRMTSAPLHLVSFHTSG